MLGAFGSLAFNTSSVSNSIQANTQILLDEFFRVAPPLTEVTWGQVVVTLIAVVASGYMLLIASRPLAYRRKQHEVDCTWTDGNNRINSRKAAIRTKKIAKDYPPPFPNGWFNLCLSRELAKGEVRDVSCLGMHLVLFRGYDGKAYVMDKYCQHLGANLAVGGIVKDNCIQCPFHGWRFRGTDGKCTHIEYAQPGEKIPDWAGMQTHKIMERNGMILLWHDAEGREPFWEFEPLPGIGNGTWWYHGFSEHFTAAHTQELPENGADVAHLNVLHPPFMYKWGQGIFGHAFDATWRAGSQEEGTHIAFLTLSQSFTMFGKRLPGSTVDVAIQQVGPGLVHLTFDMPFGKVTVVQTTTPVEPLLQRTVHHVWAEKKVPRPLAKWVLYALVRQFERDIPIWNSKEYSAKPKLMRGDKGIPQFRRWYGNFFSDNSKSMEQALEECNREGSYDW
eukprot:Colp12_sorted_trinity150504_noHs@15656